MLYVYLGTNREKAREAMRADMARIAPGREVVRITDAHVAPDLAAALAGGGMFDSPRALALENILSNDELRALFLRELAHMSESEDPVFLYEEVCDADMKRRLTRVAQNVATFAVPSGERSSSAFALAGALRRRDKKALWIGLMREYARGAAPEMLHGILFWAAKDMLLKGRASEASRTRGLIAALAELPHKARRSGFDLEYAIERFALELK